MASDESETEEEVEEEEEEKKVKKKTKKEPRVSVTMKLVKKWSTMLRVSLNCYISVVVLWFCVFGKA